jgi:hypothetical protein
MRDDTQGNVDEVQIYDIKLDDGTDSKMINIESRRSNSQTGGPCIYNINSKSFYAPGCEEYEKLDHEVLLDVQFNDPFEAGCYRCIIKYVRYDNLGIRKLRVQYFADHGGGIYDGGYFALIDYGKGIIIVNNDDQDHDIADEFPDYIDIENGMKYEYKTIERYQGLPQYSEPLLLLRNQLGNIPLLGNILEQQKVQNIWEQVENDLQVLVTDPMNIMEWTSAATPLNAFIDNLSQSTCPATNSFSLN